MIRVPNRLIFLPTPSTGSRSVVTALLEQCGGHKLTQAHHPKPYQIEVLDFPEPKYSFFRSPYEFLVSRHWYRCQYQVNKPTIFDFIRFYRASLSRARHRQFVAEMGGYAPYVERFFLYEYGLEHFFAEMGFPEIRLPRLGVTSEKPAISTIDSAVISYIDELFPEEVALYKSIKERYYDSGSR